MPLMIPDDPLLTLTNVSFAYEEGRNVLEGLSLSIRRGHAYALVGPNGAGKSTLVALLSGRRRPTSGTIVSDALVELGETVAVVEQHLNSFKALHVWQTFAVSQRAAGSGFFLDREQYHHLAASNLKRVGATFNADDLVAGLNHSQCQLLEIARALAQGTELLILDEPTSALDQRSRRHLLRLLADMRASGLAVILVTHSEREARTLDGEILHLREGRLMEDYDPPPPIERHEPACDTRPWGTFGFSRLGRTERVTVPVLQNRIQTLVFADALERSNLFMNLADTAESVPIEWSLEKDGKPVERPLWRYNTGISLVAADRRRFCLFPSLSVGQNFTVLARSRIRARQDLPGVVERLQIVAPSFQHLVGAMSGGNQQKLVMAGIFTARPQCVVAEEPLLGLDRDTRLKLVAELRAMAHRGVAIIILTCFAEDYDGAGAEVTEIGFQDPS